MKRAINQRFIDTVNYVISCNKEYNKGKIAAKLGIKPNTFSEILNKRTNVNIELILIFSEIFDVSIDFMLTGKGLMGKEKNKEEKPPDYDKLLVKNQQDLIEMLKNKIDDLDKTILELRTKNPYESTVQTGDLEFLNEKKLGEKIGKIKL